MEEAKEMAAVREELNFNKVFHFFLDLGCCKLCCLRFIGEKKASSFLDPKEILKVRKIQYIEEDDQPNKIPKCNPCKACLGLLQKPYCDNIIDNILNDLLKKEYDCEDFNIALNLPVSCQLRAHSLFLHLKSTFPGFFSYNFPLGVVTVGIKDVWKWLYAPLLSQLLGKAFEASSELSITVAVKYPEEEAECASLFLMSPEKFSKTRNRKNQGSQDNFSRKGADTFLKLIDTEKFKSCYPVPPSDPASPVSFSELITLRNSVYIAGRYNKLSRTLPQTPWILNGERKAEGSVEELISETLTKFANATDSKFAASGREDVDVRALGRGRPFYIELVNPSKCSATYEELRALEEQVNQGAAGQIYVRDLQFVPKSSLEQIKEGEEQKVKVYRALCLLLDHSARDKVNDGLKHLSAMFPLTLQQSTPIRVLHRRPVAVRPKVVHSVDTTLLDENKDLFTITLQTQAGTYIKEFVHGDFGRTTPSLGDLLGGVEVDILALDVMDILLDWPPPVKPS